MARVSLFGAALRLSLLFLQRLSASSPQEREADHHEVTERVQAMYEVFPFPSHDPEQLIRRGTIWERGGGYIGPSHVPDISHHLFGGRLEQRFRASGNTFRVLVAGGGTGVTTLALAQQLSAVGGLRWSIVHLDLTRASIAVAEQRLAANGLSERVAFVQASLLDVTSRNIASLFLERNHFHLCSRVGMICNGAGHSGRARRRSF